MSPGTLNSKITHRKSPIIGQSDKLSRYFEGLASSGFFGKVLVSFQNGKIHELKIEQTKKFDEIE